MRVLVVLFLAASLLQAGCASIPLSTAIRLASLEPRTLAQVDASEVRVRVSIPAGYELNVATSSLNLSLHSPTGVKQEGELGLSLLQVTPESRSTGFFTANVPVFTYVLALTPEGVNKLRDIQEFLLSDHINEFKFGVNASLAKIPRNARQITFWADVKLFANEQYFPLINGAKIKFEDGATGS